MKDFNVLLQAINKGFKAGVYSQEESFAINAATQSVAQTLQALEQPAEDAKEAVKGKQEPAGK